MIRHTVRALCAASLIVAPLALSTPAHAVVTCTVNGFPRTANVVTGTAGNDYIRCDSLPPMHGVDGLGGNDYIIIDGTVASGAFVFGNAGSDYLRVNVNNGSVNGGTGNDFCRVATGNPPVNCEV
ncbi:hypothetical protein ACFYV5_01100 [Streptomyces sp. NPDC003035]|uniref:hypothetical protein n=1 Tax=Streptomyces sp. NPDC003035 TaxID=3364676 RepID=UPI0036B8A846